MVVLLGPAVGAAGASAAPAPSWSRGDNTITSHGFGNAGGVGGPNASRAFPRTRSGSLVATGASASGFGSITTYADTITASGITAGPDGALWFTNSLSIGRITTTGQVTNYTGTGIDGPDGITAGPDGALWFTNNAGNSIGRITTAGHVTIYTGTGISAPDGITAGPDGALWFNEADANKIGRITTSGVTTEYSLGSNGRRNTLKEKLR